MGNWTVFAFLAVSVFITIYLGWRLGTGSEYVDVRQTAGVALEASEPERSESNAEEKDSSSSVKERKVDV